MSITLSSRKVDVLARQGQLSFRCALATCIVDNQARLAACSIPHDFHLTNHPNRHVLGGYRCSRCGGYMFVENIHWWSKGGFENPRD